MNNKKMTPSQITLFVVTLIGGICVLLSYYICFFKLFKPQNYIKHDVWLDMPETYRYAAVVFQVCAVIGFLRLFVFLITNTPEKGILSHTACIIILLFLVASAIWPIALYYKQKSITVICLLVAAVSCILLLVGCVESKVPLDVMLSAFALNIVCVLQDCIVWNAAYLMV